jgi:hypothetical protein
MGTLGNIELTPNDSGLLVALRLLALHAFATQDGSCCRHQSNRFRHCSVHRDSAEITTE